jgi:hypothetical protein
MLLTRLTVGVSGLASVTLVLLAIQFVFAAPAGVV